MAENTPGSKGAALILDAYWNKNLAGGHISWGALEDYVAELEARCRRLEIENEDLSAALEIDRDALAAKSRIIWRLIEDKKAMREGGE